MAEPPPVGGQTGATTEPTTKPLAAILSASRLQAVVVDVNVDVRVEEEEVHAVELDAVHLGLGGQVQHGIEVDAGFGAGAAFADQAGPHGVVQFGKGIRVLRVHKNLVLEIALTLTGAELR